MKLTIPISSIGGDSPGQAEQMRERYEMRARQTRLDNLFRRMLDVPPPEKWPSPEDFPEAPKGGTE